MTLKDLVPTWIKEVFFPTKKEAGSSTAAGTDSTTFSPAQISDFTIPTSGVAHQLISSVLNTETRTINSNFMFQSTGAISIGTVSGSGTSLSGTGIRISPYGIYGYAAGVTKFSLNAITGDATFAGTVTAIAGQIGGWDIGASALTTSTGTVGMSSAITGGNDIRFWAGNGTPGSAPFRVLEDGTFYATSGNFTGSISGSTITGTSVVIDSQAAGGDPGTGSYLRWHGGSRMWEDSSHRLGINSIVSPMSVYVDSTLRLTIPNSGQITLADGLNVSTGNFNVSDGDSRFRKNVYIDYDNIGFGDGGQGTGGQKLLTLRDFGITISNDGSGRRQLNMGGYTFAIDASAGSPWFNVNGNAKSAIVPTSQGYNALYCAEAPEVWFFDFCKTKKKIDPLFLEVTEGDLRFIKCDKGYQVWRRRKGHAGKRFEAKTAFQFYKNEKFLQMAK